MSLESDNNSFNPNIEDKTASILLKYIIILLARENILQDTKSSAENLLKLLFSGVKHTQYYFPRNPEKWERILEINAEACARHKRTNIRIH